MRRITLGILILGGGTLLSLPFRKPAFPDPSSVNDQVDQKKANLFDEKSIQLLVREVTRDVEVPMVYDPHTDYSPPPAVTQTRQLPLTYDDLAVPVARDPFYENRFNAAASVAGLRADAAKTRRMSELERVFAETQYVDQSIAGLQYGAAPPSAIPVEGKQWAYQDAISDRPPATAPGRRAAKDAKLASSESAGTSIGASKPADISILSPLPPPTNASDSAATERPRQWIRQPD